MVGGKWVVVLTTVGFEVFHGDFPTAKVPIYGWDSCDVKDQNLVMSFSVGNHLHGCLVLQLAHWGTFTCFECKEMKILIEGVRFGILGNAKWASPKQCVVSVNMTAFTCWIFFPCTYTHSCTITYLTHESFSSFWPRELSESLSPSRTADLEHGEIRTRRCLRQWLRLWKTCCSITLLFHLRDNIYLTISRRGEKAVSNGQY